MANAAIERPTNAPQGSRRADPEDVAHAFDITATSNLDQLVGRFSRTARVFVARRMHCVGCALARFDTVADAARCYGQPLDVLVHDLRSAAADE